MSIDSNNFLSPNNDDVRDTNTWTPVLYNKFPSNLHDELSNLPKLAIDILIVFNLHWRLFIADNNGVKDSLYLSFAVSLINLCYNFYKFKSEAQLHGMAWSEYALRYM